MSARDLMVSIDRVLPASPERVFVLEHVCNRYLHNLDVWERNTRRQVRARTPAATDLSGSDRCSWR